MVAAPLLRLSGVSKTFGALVVTDDLTLDVPEGQALGILGPNGAGKSTLFNLIGGGLRPSQGNIQFAGRDVTGLPPHARARLGIGRSYQIPHPFAKMTVFENLLVGASFGDATPRPNDEKQARCVHILHQTGLLPKANRLAGSLTLLERKRLELARALATSPRLLLLDEIAGGLTEAECNSLVETIKSVHQQGTTIIWIEHLVHALMQVAERLIVLNFGRLLADGAPQTVMASSAVREIYMGIGA